MAGSFASGDTIYIFNSSDQIFNLKDYDTVDDTKNPDINFDLITQDNGGTVANVEDTFTGTTNEIQ